MVKKFIPNKNGRFHGQTAPKPGPIRAAGMPECKVEEVRTITKTMARHSFELNRRDTPTAITVGKR